jgi:tetratricopeptide (TPR) repeat protein
MGNLASTYSALGRHDEALKLQQETLAFRQRVLPENHPDIATSMNNLASTYSALGRHDKALTLQQETVAFSSGWSPTTTLKLQSA